MKKVGMILIISALIIMSVPFIGNRYMQAKREHIYTSYLQQLEEKQTNSTLVNENLIQESNDEKHQKKEVCYRFQEDEVMGRVKVPSIGVDVLLIEGESKKNLKLGAAHMLGTAYPGEIGNCIIAGHRNYTFGSMFNRLGEVQLKDQISVEVRELEYIYEVDNIEIITPEDLQVLEQPRDERRLTLLTCHPIHVGNKRLLIKAKLVSSVTKG